MNPSPASAPPAITADADAHISRTVRQERGRLLRFIRRFVPALPDAEDILQDVFQRLVAAYPEIEAADSLTGWLFAATRNRITDYQRKRRSEPWSARQSAVAAADGDEALPSLEDVLWELGADPLSHLQRGQVWEVLEAALAELPEEQRWVFVQTEFEARPFAELMAETGLSKGTLLSRKRYAVLHLRDRLQELYNEIKTND